MQIGSAQNMLKEIQANLDKLSATEKLKFVEDLNRQLQAVNKDLEALAKLVQDKRPVAPPHETP